VRYDPNRRDLDAINTSLTLSDSAWFGRAPRPTSAPAPTGSNVTLAYRRMAFGLADPERATLAELIGSLAPPQVAPGGQIYQAEQLDLSGVLRTTTGFGLSGGVSYLPHTALSPLDTYAKDSLGNAIGTASTRAGQLEDGFIGYRLGLDYASPCGCWGLHAAASFQPNGGGATRTASTFYSPNSFVFSLEANRIAGPF
jgi:hypothetical protein